MIDEDLHNEWGTRTIFFSHFIFVLSYKRYMPFYWFFSRIIFIPKLKLKYRSNLFSIFVILYIFKMINFYQDLNIFLNISLLLLLLICCCLKPYCIILIRTNLFIIIFHKLKLQMIGCMWCMYYIYISNLQLQNVSNSI